MTEDPPTAELLDSTTVFSMPPAAGFKLSVARPTTEGLVTLVAVTVTVIFEGTSGGAVYLPEAEIVPAAGLPTTLQRNLPVRDCRHERQRLTGGQGAVPGEIVM